METWLQHDLRRAAEPRRGQQEAESGDAGFTVCFQKQRKMFVSVSVPVNMTPMEEQMIENGFWGVFFCNMSIDSE